MGSLWISRALALAVCLAGCDATTDPVDHAADPAPTIMVHVTLDGAPVGGARVTQGGAAASVTTGVDGRASLPLDLHVDGELVVMASHPDARIGNAPLVDDPDEPGALDALPSEVTITLTRFDPNDNPDYVFQDPGTPTRRASTAQCAHCHLTINDDWWRSPHRTSASNPVVQALYRGTIDVDEATCGARGGTWVEGTIIKGRPEPSRCYDGRGALPILNPDACPGGVCGDGATAFGACADCHAPGLDGALGGRDLRDAEGIALEAGVHCDVCHRVRAIDLDAPAGVAGRLVLHRPMEPSSSLALGRFQPLTFGPDHDVANPRMGLVQRDHFHESTLCAGCHELQQAALVPGTALDPQRWPSGRLPIHTTYGEWLESPLAPAAACQGCHMPPAPGVWNGADLQVFVDVGAGLAAGWVRPPGSVRHHSFIGPRTPQSRLLELAAALTITSARDGDRLVASVTVDNVGPGHALPTGEPLRAVLLVVTARCGDEALGAIDGDVIDDVGGALDRRARGDDWGRWPGAAVGDVVRVVARPGGFVDYDGVPPFEAGGRFDAAAKGWPRELARGEATIVALEASGVVTFDRPLPDGDLAYRGRPGGDAPALAGAPGVAFARVLVGRDGARQVPHHEAVDVARDNRLRPGQAWTSRHVFRATCTTPEVHARLLHRPLPLALAAERGGPLADRLMTEARR